MIKTDRHSVYFSVDNHLNTTKSLIDSRTPSDRINFLTSFSRLLNFYDKSNQLEGNWQAFLLKDPVFTSLKIGKADLKQFVFTFQQLTKTLETYIQRGNFDQLGQPVSSLIRLIATLFETLNQWVNWLNLTTENYHLKESTLNLVEITLGPLFWAFAGFTNFIATNDLIADIRAIPQSFTANFKAKVWQINKNKQPFWDVLQEDTDAVFYNRTLIVEKLNWIGQLLLIQLNKIGKTANAYQTELENTTDNHPDTLLIRSFVELIELNQIEVNKITDKHLAFYYKTILKQNLLPAQPDSVFLALQLAEGFEAYELPPRTQFNAGVDANKKPIVFETTTAITLNALQITTAYTLAIAPNSQKTAFQLKLNQLNKPNTVVKDADGTPKAWETFGSAAYEPTGGQALGVAFASPLLYLTSGTRRITVTFTFADVVGRNVVENGTYFLSTAKKWLPITPLWSNTAKKDEAEEWIATFTLNATDPAITVFDKWADGYTADWPVLKCLFKTIDSITSPPLVMGIAFDTDVLGFTDFSLSNENGSLKPAKPFQLFGPVANVGSAFYMGSAEVFSKPVINLSLGFNWKGLPHDFIHYYAVYSAFLIWSQLDNPAVTAPKPSNAKILKLFGKTDTSQAYSFADVVAAMTATDPDAALQKLGIDTTDLDLSVIVTNQSFKVGFEQLVNGTWIPLTVQRKINCDFTKFDEGCTNPVNPDVAGGALNLFSVDAKDTTKLSKTTFYCYKSTDGLAAAPHSQKEPFKALSNESKNDFLRMTMTAPAAGFGNDIFPKVVSFVALQNANFLMHENDFFGTPASIDKQILSTPSAPYTPMADSFLLNYQAKHSYALDYKPIEPNNPAYPIQCFQYSVFENFLVYDNSVDPKEYGNQIGKSICGVEINPLGVPMYQPFGYDGVLMLKAEKIAATNGFTVYFELAQSPFIAGNATNQYDYLYKTNESWVELSLVSDETAAFSKSGIMTFEAPLDIAQKHVELPNNAYWLAIGVKGSVDTINQTLFLAANGAMTKRTAQTTLNSTGELKIAPDTVKAPLQKTPQIATVLQPFESFNGKPAEKTKAFNNRVSARLKNKDRAVTANDYATIIYGNFDQIFYSKLNFNKVTRTVELYLVQKVKSSTSTNAAAPLISNALQNEASTLIKAKSGYQAIAVSNFELNYLTVKASIYIEKGFALNQTANRITQALKVFLSPWIESQQNQIPIDQGITTNQVADFISSFNEVAEIGDITFELKEKLNHQTTVVKQSESFIQANKPNGLLVPDAYQGLNYQFVG